MNQAQQDAIRQLRDVIHAFHFAQIGDFQSTSEAVNTARRTTRLRSAIQRLAPPNSPYIQGATNDDEHTLLGVAKALLDDYEAGCLLTIREIINADLFSDFLAMAEHLLQEEELRQPAAVMAGGVLEEHLRKLCAKHNIATMIDGSHRKSSALNDDLARSQVYGKNDQKQVTAWLGIRNSAAHGRFEEFDATQTRNMIDGLRTFIARLPA